MVGIRCRQEKLIEPHSFLEVYKQVIIVGGGKELLFSDVVTSKGLTPL